jgi:FKBP-type peptidyl-prolyl cis-trans isomerase (trigger factor)
MKSRCTKEELLKNIKAQIRREYESQVEAAAELGQTKQNLNAVLKGKTKDIPDWLIERYGYRKVTVYERIR